MAAEEPDISQTTYFFRRRGADVEGVQVAEVTRRGPAARGLQRVIADVRDHHDAGAAVLGDGGGHGADRTEAGDGHRLAGQVDDLRRMHGVAEGVEEGADAQRHVRAEPDHVRRRHLHELGEGAVFVQAVDLRARADVAVAGAALRALAADNVHLGGDIVADGEVLALRAFSELLDEAAEFVAVDPRRRHRLLNRRVPVVDVLVGAADGGRCDTDEHLVRARHRNGTLANFRTLASVERSTLDDSQHEDLSLIVVR